jgi:hypothetical protein
MVEAMALANGAKWLSFTAIKQMHQTVGLACPPLQPISSRRTNLNAGDI